MCADVSGGGRDVHLRPPTTDDNVSGISMLAFLEVSLIGCWRMTEPRWPSNAVSCSTTPYLPLCGIKFLWQTNQVGAKTASHYGAIYHGNN
jgi:hypothetical protein